MANSNEEQRQWVERHMIDMFSQNTIKYLCDMREKTARVDSKIYKYYSFEKDPKKVDYAIENLKDGTIHFSKPETFNDPFDCVLGASIDDIVETLMHEIISLQIAKGNETLSANRELIEGLLFGKVNNNTEDNVYLDFISNLLSMESIKEYIQKAYKGEELTQDDQNVMVQEILKDPKTSNDIIKMLFSGNIEKLSNQNELIRTLFAKISENKELLSQFIPEDKITPDIELGKNLIDACDSKLSLTQRLQKISDISGQNINIQEEINKRKPLLRDTVKKAIQIINNTFAVSCFSERPDNILMWSYYADKHQGICVEYDLNKCKEKEMSLLLSLFPVEYTDVRPGIPMEIFDLNDLNNIKVKNDADSTMKLAYTLLIKYKDWCHEKEWRSIRVQSSLDKNLNMNVDIISAVYLGANISKEKELEVINICKEKGIPIKKYDIDTKEYKLVLQKL